MWGKIKAYLRKHKPRTAEALCWAIGHALGKVTRDDIVNWFAYCGYSIT